MRAARFSSGAAPRGGSGSRPEAGPTVPGSVDRRHRLSRSRDFDAVYRQGRSVSTRFLVLYWFARNDGEEEPRIGLAVPRKAGGAVTRNRLKRQLREVWRELAPRLTSGHDYVLVVRPGLAEATEARGFAWLHERVIEVVQKAGHLEAQSA